MTNKTQNKQKFVLVDHEGRFIYDFDYNFKLFSGSYAISNARIFDSIDEIKATLYQFLTMVMPEDIIIDNRLVELLISFLKIKVQIVTVIHNKNSKNHVTIKEDQLYQNYNITLLVDNLIKTALISVSEQKYAVLYHNMYMNKIKRKYVVIINSFQNKEILESIIDDMYVYDKGKDRTLGDAYFSSGEKICFATDIENVSNLLKLTTKIKSIVVYDEFHPEIALRLCLGSKQTEYYATLRKYSISN